MIITIPRAALRAVAYFSAEHDIRQYMNGVHVEAGPEECRLVATDGNTMGVVRLPGAAVGLERPVCITIPGDVVANARKAPKRAPAVLYLTPADGGRWVLGEEAFAPVDGRFPPWRRVVPARPTGEAQQLDPALLYRFQQAADALGVRGVDVRQNGTGAALVTLPNWTDFFGLIMPIRMPRDYTPVTKPPAWATADV